LKDCEEDEAGDADAGYDDDAVRRRLDVFFCWNRRKILLKNELPFEVKNPLTI